MDSKKIERGRERRTQRRKRERAARKQRVSSSRLAWSAGFEWKYFIALLLGFLPALAVAAHVPGFNGPFYWKWRFTDIPIGPFALYIALAAGVIYWVHTRLAANGNRRRWAVLSLTLIHFGLMIAFMSETERSLETVRWRVQHPDITSYHTEALKIEDLDEWLSSYAERLPLMGGHTQTHPPAPIFYFFLWNKALGPNRGALWGGIFIGLLASLAVPMIYLLTREVAGTADAGLLAATIWSLLPGVLSLLGSFDPMYALFTCLLLYSWTQAVWMGRRSMAVWFGFTLAAAMLWTHSFFVLGACFVLLALFGWVWSDEREVVARRIITSAGIAAAVVLGAFGFAYLATGYNHWAALRQSIRIQEGLAPVWNRPYHYAVFWDLYDYFLAAGFLSWGVIVALLSRRRSGWTTASYRPRAFAAASLLGLLIVDFTGLLRGEAARVWLFLQPLTIVLVGMELSYWDRGWRYCAIALMLVNLLLIRTRLSFL